MWVTELIHTLYPRSYKRRTLLLLRAGYDWAQYSSHEKDIEDSKERYYIALRNAQATFQKKHVRYDDWFEFFLMVVEKQIVYLRVQVKNSLRPLD